MTHAERTDPHARAADLRLWALGLLVDLLDLVGVGLLTRALRGWAAALLRRGERAAMALVLLAALKKTPPVPPPLQRTLRPLAAPRGFCCRERREPRIAQMARGLFPRQRCLIARARRLVQVLADLDAAVRPVLRRLARLPVFTGLVAIAPPAARLAPCPPPASCATPDTS